RLRDGSERTVELAELSKLPIAQVEELRLADPPPADRWRLGYLVQTTAGDSLRTERLRLRNDRLLVETPLAGLTELPLHAAALIWLTPPATIPDATRREIERTATGTLRQDTVFVRKEGEWVKVEGILQSLDENRVVFRWQETEREIPLTLAAAIALAGSRPPVAPRETLAAVHGRDGSCLVGAVRSWTAESITLDSPALGAVTMPLDGVAVLDAIWGRSVFVSDLEPATVNEAGYYGTKFPWRRNASVSGGPLMLRGHVFERGLGVHSRSSLTYRLDKKFSLLTGMIGLNDGASALGHAEFVVRGDGKELFRTAMAAGEAPKPLRVNVSGMEKLELLVDFGRNEDTGDHADWAELRLVK
ncbi:MAG: hypothetical protein FJ388_20850, partial [Verrucomicrobia bacterium]|nr:hypothetical protein [Verrucomicrobiota bacterium]